MERTRFEQELDDLGIGKRYFESDFFPGFEFDTGVSADASSAPALMKNVETSPLQKTLYVNISLGIGSAPNKDGKSFNVQPMTGIFIPKNFVPQKEIDVVLYLHGHKGASPGNDVSIDGYWNNKVQHFALREEVNESGRSNIIFVAPTLGPLAQYGNLATTKGFDGYISKVLAALNEHYAGKNSLPEIKNFGRIILSGHSGGGSPMLRIAELNSSANASKIGECWGFDSVYGDVEKRWVDWAAAHPSAKLYFYSFDTAGRSRTLKKLAENKKLQNVCVYEWSGSDFNVWAKSRNLKKSTVGPHFWIPIVYLKERLQNSPCRVKQTPVSSNKGTASVPKTESKPDTISSSGGGSNADFKLSKVGLYKNKIKIAGAGSKKNKTYVEIRESPSVFMPEIIGNARAKALKDKKPDIAAKLDPDRWFSEFTRITFLGRPLNEGQYLHIEMAELLKTIEAKFLAELGMSDAKKAGDILLKNSSEGLSGSRPTSSTATFSMHMFGLAVDVNYRGNPYIEEGDITAVNNVLRNAASLMNTKLLTYRKHEKDRFADRFDFIRAMDETIENYFKLLDDSSALENFLQSSQSSDWHGLPVTDAKKKIQKNLDNLAGFLARAKYKDYFKKHAILDFDKRFVAGMEKWGLHWGGDYGDMMHFDLRKTGVGFYIEQARNEYAGKVKKQAARLYKEKKYGEFSPE